MRWVVPLSIFVLVLALIGVALYQNPGIYKRFALFQSFYIEDDETVYFFPTIGRIVDDRLVVNIHGWIYEDYHNNVVRNIILKGVYQWFGISKDDKILKDRVWPFVVDNQSGKRITLYFNPNTAKEQAVLLAYPSSATGQFKEALQFSKEETAAILSMAGNSNSIKFEARSENNTVFRGKAFILKDRGVSIISDIEDTIRISCIRNQKLFFENTFIKPFQAVPSLSSLYNQMKKIWEKDNVNFHYVNGSPWPFYPLYAQFLQENNFPNGTYHFRNVRFKSAIDAFSPSKEFKFQTIDPIFSAFPQRRFLLIGDSAEFDAEVYALLAKKYPSQIIQIFIRNVNNDGVNDPDLNKRLETIFTGVPDSKWTLFEDDKISSLLRATA